VNRCLPGAHDVIQPVHHDRSQIIEYRCTAVSRAKARDPSTSAAGADAYPSTFGQYACSFPRTAPARHDRDGNSHSIRPCSSRMSRRLRSMSRRRRRCSSASAPLLEERQMALMTHHTRSGRRRADGGLRLVMYLGTIRRAGRWRSVPRSTTSVHACACVPCRRARKNHARASRRCVAPYPFTQSTFGLPISSALPRRSRASVSRWRPAHASSERARDDLPPRGRS